MAAWKLFGHDVTTEQLPAELSSILAQMQRERVAFEALTNGAREAAQNLAQSITSCTFYLHHYLFAPNIIPIYTRNICSIQRD